MVALRGSAVMRARRAASRLGATARPAALARRRRRSSPIGATVALASIRSVAGGTGKTAVGMPAAAHTTG